MNMVMFTQLVDRNASVLGFAHKWIRTLSENVDRLFVLANGVGEYDLPENTDLFSLRAERNPSRPVKLWRLQRFLYRILSDHNVHGAFVHQIEHYGLAVWAQLKFRGIPVIQFKAHKGIPWTLWLANYLFDGFVTSSRGGLELPDDRKVVIGQGIDTELFSPGGSDRDINEFRVVSVGRISPVKDYETLIRGFDRLIHRKGFTESRLTIVGGPGTPEQEDYLKELKSMTRDRDLESYVEFMPPVPNEEVPDIYRQADVFVNLSRTGSLDKAVLEAMACETPIITSNWAYEAVLPDSLHEQLMVEPGDEKTLADRLLWARKLNTEDRRELGRQLRSIVVENHNLERFMERLVDVFQVCRRESWGACVERFNHPSPDG